MKYLRAVTVPLEIVHVGPDGRLHGHGLQVEGVKTLFGRAPGHVTGD
jgi:hypothetical protein